MGRWQVCRWVGGRIIYGRMTMVYLPITLIFTVSDKAKRSIPFVSSKCLLVGINGTLNAISPENPYSTRYVYLATIKNLKLFTLLKEIYF